MRNKSLLPIPDKTREYWCLLLLDVENVESRYDLTGWHIADANHSRIVRRASFESLGEHPEQQPIVALAEELARRQYHNRTLITPSRTTIEVLRNLLLEIESNTQSSLRGFRHFALREAIELHFASVERFVPVWQDEFDSQEHDLESLWECRIRVGGLLPLEVVQGARF